MKARRRGARRRAIDILFQADAMGRSPSAVLAEREGVEERVPEYAREVIAAIEPRLGEIDRLLGEASEEWTVARMAAVDRAILRVAVYELLWREDVPVAVAIDEAVELAKELSTADSGGFVNGVLGRIARDHAETA